MAEAAGMGAGSRAAGRVRALTPAEAAALYLKGMSACEIAEAFRITRGGSEARIRAGGLGGVQWCPIHRTCEELRHVNAEAVSYMTARRGPAAGSES